MEEPGRNEEDVHEGGDSSGIGILILLIVAGVAILLLGLLYEYGGAMMDSPAGTLGPIWTLAEAMGDSYPIYLAVVIGLIFLWKWMYSEYDEDEDRFDARPDDDDDDYFDPWP